MLKQPEGESKTKTPSEAVAKGGVGVSEPQILQIPCLLSKVTTLVAGGHRLTFDAFETSAAEVRELIGKENKVNFVLCLVEMEKVEQKDKCPSLKKHLTFKQ